MAVAKPFNAGTAWPAQGGAERQWGGTVPCPSAVSTSTCPPSRTPRTRPGPHPRRGWCRVTSIRCCGRAHPCCRSRISSSACTSRAWRIAPRHLSASLRASKAWLSNHSLQVTAAWRRSLGANSWRWLSSMPGGIVRPCAWGGRPGCGSRRVGSKRSRRPDSAWNLPSASAWAVKRASSTKRATLPSPKFPGPRPSWVQPTLRSGFSSKKHGMIWPGPRMALMPPAMAMVSSQMKGTSSPIRYGFSASREALRSGVGPGQRTRKRTPASRKKLRKGSRLILRICSGQTGHGTHLKVHTMTKCSRQRAERSSQWPSTSRIFPSGSVWN
mmetsp:Transcript_19695/g.59423  ORF Transcript_19695/g.59423 Transcript_19695/m.59423 type:complete len:327 (+) Transcript_19695:288-1268(+)